MSWDSEDEMGPPPWGADVEARVLECFERSASEWLLGSDLQQWSGCDDSVLDDLCELGKLEAQGGKLYRLAVAGAPRPPWQKHVRLGVAPEELYAEIFLRHNELAGFPLDSMKGRLYRHRSKQTTYSVTSVVVREHDLEPLVVYRGIGGYIDWCRPLSEFAERFVLVDRKYP